MSKYNITIEYTGESEKQAIKATLELIGARVLELKKVRKKRSLPQNAFYWAVVLPEICKQLNQGDIPEEIHALCKSMFLKRYRVLKNKRYTWIDSTTKLDSFAFGEYLEQVMSFFSREYGVYFPTPTDSYSYPEFDKN